MCVLFKCDYIVADNFDFFNDLKVLFCKFFAKFYNFLTFPLTIDVISYFPFVLSLFVIQNHVSSLC
jgi:hypothetical protein